MSFRYLNNDSKKYNGYISSNHDRSTHSSIISNNINRTNDRNGKRIFVIMATVHSRVRREFRALWVFVEQSPDVAPLPEAGSQTPLHILYRGTRARS